MCDLYISNLFYDFFSSIGLIGEMFVSFLYYSSFISQLLFKVINYIGRRLRVTSDPFFKMILIKGLRTINGRQLMWLIVFVLNNGVIISSLIKPENSLFICL